MASAPEAKAKSAAATAPGDAVRDGDKRLRNMTTRVSTLKHFRDRAVSQKDGAQLSCVQFQEAKAKVILQLAQQAQETLVQSSSDNDSAETAFQSSRLAMLDDMLNGVHKAVRLCIDDELSTVQSFKVEINSDTKEAPALDPGAVPLINAPAGRPPER